MAYYIEQFGFICGYCGRGPYATEDDAFDCEELDLYEEGYSEDQIEEWISGEWAY